MLHTVVLQLSCVLVGSALLEVYSAQLKASESVIEQLAIKRMSHLLGTQYRERRNRRMRRKAIVLLTVESITCTARRAPSKAVFWFFATFCISAWITGVSSRRTFSGKLHFKNIQKRKDNYVLFGWNFDNDPLTLEIFYEAHSLCLWKLILAPVLTQRAFCP